MVANSNSPQDFDTYQQALNQIISNFSEGFDLPRMEIVSQYPESGEFDIMVVVGLVEDDEESERDQIKDVVQPKFLEHGILLPEPEERAEGNWEDEVEYFFTLKVGVNPDITPFV